MHLPRWTQVSRVVPIALMAMAAAATPAAAQTWFATLTGAAEAPPNLSPGTGSAIFTLSGNLFTVNVSFSGLTTGVTNAHIHCCTQTPFTGTAGVATQVPTFVGFPTGVDIFSGTYNMTFNLNDASFYNPAFVSSNAGSVALARDAFVTGLNSGTTYINIHTSRFPAGEIRGFITTVPEPSTVALMACGMLGIAGALRRRAGRAHRGAA